jgi:hypothetical protein
VAAAAAAAGAGGGGLLLARERFWLDLKGWFVIPGVLTAGEIARCKAEVLAGATDAYDTPALSELLDHPAITGILTELLSEPPFAGVPVQRYDGSGGPAEYSGAESSASDESLPFRCENSFVVRRSAGNVALGGTNQTVGPHPQEGPHVNRPPQHAHPLRYQHVGGRIFGGLLRVAWGKKARTGSTGV